MTSPVIGCRPLNRCITKLILSVARARFLIALMVACSSVWLVNSRPAQADEGMWLFSNLPLKYLAEKHGFKPDADWANHLSTLR